MSIMKRRDLTSDDLLRQFEERCQKRRKLSCDSDSEAEVSVASSQSEDSDSEFSLETHALDRMSKQADSPKATRNKDPSSPSINPSVTFTSLGVSRSLQSALSAMSIHHPTEIQVACIPPLLAGRDCIGNAKTGSGKTVAFAIPILQKLSLDPYGIFAVVLTPTRELAFQISEQFAALGSSMNIRTAVIVGGMDSMAQATELKNRPHVVVATPGRLVDLVKSTHSEWDLSRVRILILDEADRLLSPTFTRELSFLFEVLPKSRQTGLFTATYTPALESIANAPAKPGKQPPVVHRIHQSIETVDTLSQYFLMVPPHVRECYLFYLLCNPPESIVHLRRAPPEASERRNHKWKVKASEAMETQQPPPTIIFCRKPRTAAYLTLVLKGLSIRSTSLHSRLTQRERLASLGLFKSSVIPVLVSTDVGARGLDIDEVALVVNWDLPDEPEEYTHRVGRTARAGKSGIAVSFIGDKDEDRLLKVEQRINTTLQEMIIPESAVLEKLNTVSTAKRLANMELHDTQFGKREETNKAKRM